MVTKVQYSRQLNFSGQNLPEAETVESIKGDDSELLVTTLNNTLDDENGDLKILEISKNEPDMSTSFATKEQGHFKGDVKNDLCSNTKNTLYGGNMQSNVSNKRSSMHRDKKPLEFSKSIIAVDVDNSLEITESDGTELISDKRKCSSEQDKVPDVEIEKFEMSSDEDLFGDPLEFADALCHETQAQGTDDDSQQSFDVMDEKQCHHLSQIVASVKQENNSNTHEMELPLSSVKTKSQLDDKKERLSGQPSSTQRQKSLLPFVSKSNMKTGSTKQSLKQTDIGVFFGLKPLAKPGDSKLTCSQNDTKALSSSQPSSVCRRYGGWKGRKTQNQSDANNTGHMSEGQSSGLGEEVPVASQSQKTCPFYKKIPGSTVTVDAFRYGDIPGCRAYFLSHFHYDHYGGLNGKFTNPIYCSKVSESASHY